MADDFYIIVPLLSLVIMVSKFMSSAEDDGYVFILTNTVFLSKFIDNYYTLYVILFLNFVYYYNYLLNKTHTFMY